MAQSFCITVKLKDIKLMSAKKLYMEHRQNSTKQYRALETSRFLQCIVTQFQKEGWSLDAAVKAACFPDIKLSSQNTVQLR